MPRTENPQLVSVGRQVLGLAFWLMLSFLTAYIGAVASLNAPTFYAQLTQPEWAPPVWLFGPVWTTLFALMAVAAWLVWRRGGFGAQRKPLVLFVAQLAFNGLWGWLFFAWQLGGWAFLDIALLWFLIAATIVAFWRTSRLAGLMLVPYIAWVSFAGMLNLTLWQLNPHLLGG